MRRLTAVCVLVAIAAAACAQTAEDLLRGVQAGQLQPAPRASLPPATSRVSPERARQILREVEASTRAARRPSGLKTRTAEELLEGVGSGAAPAPAATSPGSARTAEDLLKGDAPASRAASPRPSARDDFDAPASGARPARPAARRTRDELAEIFVDAQKGAKYAGNDRCIGCHERYGEEGRPSLFGLYAISQRILVPQRRGCEGCHGPGSKHADGEVAAITNPRRLTKQGLANLCYSCHVVGQIAGDRARHFPGHDANHVSCLNCHRVHLPAAEKALREQPNRLCMGCHRDVASEFLRRSKHPVRPEGPTPLFSNREGKMRCIDCHRNWSRARDPVGREPTVQTCQECHAETRGPFLFNHDAGSEEMADGCVTCHMPHGSPQRHLLRQNGRALCLNCHTDFAIGHFPGPTCSTTGCHTDIHGSNTNVFLLR